MNNLSILARDLKNLSMVYSVQASDDWRWIEVGGVRLPPGFNYTYTEILIDAPRDYPLMPPGVATPLYVRPYLLFSGQPLADVHPDTTPGWGNWAWFCYRRIDWNPHRDNLITFMEMVRADLTDPPTR
jgi:hypothetical protein